MTFAYTPRAEFKRLVRELWYPRWSPIEKKWTPGFFQAFYDRAGVHDHASTLVAEAMKDLLVREFAPSPQQLALALRDRATPSAAKPLTADDDESPPATKEEWLAMSRAVRAKIRALQEAEKNIREPGEEDEAQEPQKPQEAAEDARSDAEPAETIPDSQEPAPAPQAPNTGDSERDASWADFLAADGEGHEEREAPPPADPDDPIFKDFAENPPF